MSQVTGWTATAVVASVDIRRAPTITVCARRGTQDVRRVDVRLSRGSIAPSVSNSNIVANESGRFTGSGVPASGPKGIPAVREIAHTPIKAREVPITPMISFLGGGVLKERTRPRTSRAPQFMPRVSATASPTWARADAMKNNPATFHSARWIRICAVWIAPAAPGRRSPLSEQARAERAPCLTRGLEGLGLACSCSSCGPRSSCVVHPVVEGSCSSGSPDWAPAQSWGTKRRRLGPAVKEDAAGCANKQIVGASRNLLPQLDARQLLPVQHAPVG